MKTTAFITALVTAALAGILWYGGMFDRCTTKRECYGPVTLLYREYRGSYKGVRFLMNTMFRYARDTLYLRSPIGFAIFYDDPQSCAPDNQRSIYGIVIDTLCKPAPPNKTGVFKRTDAIVGHFRLRSFFSYATGSYKFYEALSRLVVQKKIHRNGPVMELYDIKHRSIKFIAPVGHARAPAPPFSGKPN